MGNWGYKTPYKMDLWAPTYNWRFWAHLISPNITYLDSVDVTPAAQEEIKLLVEERSSQAQPKKSGCVWEDPLSHQKDPQILSMKYWLLNTDPYNGYYNPHITE